MAHKLVSLECPNCHAQLQIEEGREYAYCSYCGAKFFIEDDSTHTTIIISRDESEIARTNAEKEIRLKEIESEKEKEKDRAVEKIIKYILPYVAFLFFFVFAFLMGFLPNEIKKIRGDICMTYSADDMVGQPTDTVVKRLKKLGFTDIELQANKPTSVKKQFELFKYDSGDVISITIDGSQITHGEYYPKNASFIVQYKK